MTARQLRKAAPGTTVAERDLVAGGVNKTIARYASFGWEAVDVAALRRTYSLTGGLLYYRHPITIIFRKLAVAAVLPELLATPEPVPAPQTFHVAQPFPVLRQPIAAL